MLTAHHSQMNAPHLRSPAPNKSFLVGACDCGHMCYQSEPNPNAIKSVNIVFSRKEHGNTVEEAEHPPQISFIGHNLHPHCHGIQVRNNNLLVFWTVDIQTMFIQLNVLEKLMQCLGNLYG